MTEILQNKNSATRFRILVEIAAAGPNIQQKSIAVKLGVTPQAISDYIQQLLKEDLIISTGRAFYRLSPKGVNWVLKVLRELRDYAALVEQAVTNITVCAAIAEHDVKQGQTVGLKMKDGLLFATSQIDGSARGVAVSSVNQGMDVDIADIEGLVELVRGMVTILQVPNITRGGSRQVDLARLQAQLSNNQPVGAIGIEALVSLRRVAAEPGYLYGVTEAAVEAAHCGLSFTIVVTDEAIPGLIKRLQEEGLNYEIIDLRLESGLA
ncbi:MAG TPA: winged helix-turn-helix transcriptional regulator [Dehalococcoidia bacterium]|nr:winged helix-turn-helix transcriptional regulator [Dehalococcoidia bacterium]